MRSDNSWILLHSMASGELDGRHSAHSLARRFGVPVSTWRTLGWCVHLDSVEHKGKMPIAVNIRSKGIGDERVSWRKKNSATIGECTNRSTSSNW